MLVETLVSLSSKARGDWPGKLIRILENVVSSEGRSAIVFSLRIWGLSLLPVRRSLAHDAAGDDDRR
jgi:hypothetical protein